MIPVQVRAFLPLVAPHVPSAPIPIVERQIRNAAIEFCERTRCWRHILDVDIEAQGEAVVAPEYAAIHEIENASFDGYPLTPVQFSKIFRPAYDDTQVGIRPEYITQTGPNTVSLYPFSSGTISLSLFLKPRGDSDYAHAGAGVLEDFYNQVPDFLLSQHGEVIAWGALARIFVIPNMPYTDPNRASFYLQRFSDGIDARFAANMRGQQRAPKRTRARFL